MYQHIKMSSNTSAPKPVTYEEQKAILALIRAGIANSPIASQVSEIDKLDELLDKHHGKK